MERHLLRQIFEDEDGKPGPATASFALMEAALRILALVAMLSTIAADLLFHRAVGLRHGSVIRAVLNVGGLMLLPKWWPAAWERAQYLNDTGLFNAALLLTFIASWIHWFLRLRPGALAVHSRSIGLPHGILYRTRIPHEVLITAVEPGILLATGMILFAWWQGFGTWVMAMAVGWAVRNTVLVFRDRRLAQDQADANWSAHAQHATKRTRSQRRPAVASVA